MNVFSKSPKNLLQSSGFTLVELLVSMAVLTLIIVMVSQLMNGTTKTIATSTKQVDEDDAARTVFNLMANDFAGMLKRNDVDYFFYKNVTSPGNDSMWFYSHAPSYFTGSVGLKESWNQSALTFVGYRIPTIDNRANSKSEKDGRHPNYVLERVGRPVTWMTGAPQWFLTGSAAPTTAAPSPGPYPATTFRGRLWGPMGDAPYCDGDWRSSAPSPSYTVSEQVFRMEFALLMKSGTYMTPSTYPAAGSETQMRQVGTDVRAIVVAIALLDPTSRVIVKDLKDAAAALPDLGTTDLTSSPPKLMMEKWNEEIRNGNFIKNSHIPLSAASQVRIYQRTFLIGGK